ncbi:WSSV475 [White spot syndrome virus]|uniref:WSSV475 n=1 Tax=White spot syndrome virus TaxID=342409 RepID=A0A2I6SCD8_9VIRU|nr:WSSV475 [White spot syndrome virus]
MDAAGNWHSRIEDSDEQGKLTVSESVGGVVPYSGTGSVAAHIWNGDALNDNGLVGAGGEILLNIQTHRSGSCLYPIAIFPV